MNEKFINGLLLGMKVHGAAVLVRCLFNDAVATAELYSVK
jgi:hypothetical protein